MTDDLARVILLVGFALVVPVGIYHRCDLAPTKDLIAAKRGG